jgi:spore maturation protein CgeB
MVKQYSESGLNPKLIYHGFDDTILKKISENSNSEQKLQYDITFVGSSGFGHGMGHRSRFWALVELIKRTKIELWIDEIEGGPRSEFKYRLYDLIKEKVGEIDMDKLNNMRSIKFMPNKIKKLITKAINEKTKRPEQKIDQLQKPLREMFPNRCRSPIFGLKMYKVLKQSRLTFNMHTDEALDSVGNLRMFQATGVGTCLLTDTGKNMSELFEEDHEVVTYTSIDECIDKMNYLLKNEDVRKKIAAAGQRRTLKDHTILNRCHEIDDILQKKL